MSDRRCARFAPMVAGGTVAASAASCALTAAAAWVAACSARIAVSASQSM
ncbi:hypothetical protein HMPREF0591_6243 [Mycobacterium parascrofulaceum ATCC BAA-614]|uniref:Lipoprotein n=1 Tax=Mycobacterium parascrofulaceum ATCC BAA-614 TaxID=525368 RepID=D5PJ99_9MYCO|nr:hypothetical protein [Mycobacterium parascrofulaceum]EFG73861.1 hypothetical protein HMPREF0591_6243 [Mycobacterium parascrofulaceum ATCC BAA-614]